MNEMNEMNQNTSTSGMTSGVDQHRPFPCDQCSKLFTRSVSTPPSSLSSLPSPHADPICCRKTYSGISVHVSLHEYPFIENQILMLYKVTAVLRARISNVADVMLDFLEGLVSIFISAMHCNNTDNFAAMCINDMVIVAARQDLQSQHLSRRCRGRVCIPPRQWSAYRCL